MLGDILESAGVVAFPELVKERTYFILIIEARGLLQTWLLFRKSESGTLDIWLQALVLLLLGRGVVFVGVIVRVHQSVLVVILVLGSVDAALHQIQDIVDIAPLFLLTELNI